MQLHWLQIRWTIQLKMCTIVHSVYDGRCSKQISKKKTKSKSMAHPSMGTANSQCILNEIKVILLKFT